MQKLKNILRQSDTVLFIGSGISLWSGLPSWPAMIEELAKFIEELGVPADLVRLEAKKGDLLQAASYGFDKLTKQQIGDFIRSSCRFGKARPHDIHEKIVSLGPRCFITTNYDDLIEQSLRKWQPDRFYRPPVTNRHLTETAEIVHARAIDFVFKPHGDAGDSESIILTREQYRQLLPQGEKQAALESVKMLLASRPILYIGFGLRDPDFMYVRDLLANTYKGGVRDHFAIMADVQGQEIDYWRRNYGIHLLNYTTIARPDGSRDHAPLLNLLESLRNGGDQTASAPSLSVITPEVLLSLARHAAALSRYPKLENELPIHVRSDSLPSDRFRFSGGRLEYSDVNQFLRAGPERAILIGLPGAGKTYALRRAAADLANELHQSCLQEAFDVKGALIPLYVDLKLYRGDLIHLLNESLPSNLSFEKLIRSFSVRIYLDSFNEMPREYWETGHYEQDFLRLIKIASNASLIIGSRTSDGLTKLGISTYRLDQIARRSVEDELKTRGVDPHSRFGFDVTSLLQRPFYFQYIASKAIDITKVLKPQDFYRQLLQNTQKSFETRFKLITFSLEKILSQVAYEALNQGEEAFSIMLLSGFIENELAHQDLVSAADAPDIINWLIGSQLLIPYSSARIAFLHQSVTEYLAATELARRYLHNPKILREKLARTRWDQALFSALNTLSDDQAATFIEDIIEIDFTLALNAAKYIETGRDAVIQRLLTEIPNRRNRENEHKIGMALRLSLPISEQHEPQLRAIVECGSSLGAHAAESLLSILGKDVKDELLIMLYERKSDFNFCQTLGRALCSFATVDDALKIVDWAECIEANSDNIEKSDKHSGFVSGAGNFISGLEISNLRAIFIDQSDAPRLSDIKMEILCAALREKNTTEALETCAELLLMGVTAAATAIYFINGPKNSNKLSWASFTAAHIYELIEIVGDERVSCSVEALSRLCLERPDLSYVVREEAQMKPRLERALLLHCIDPLNLEPLFEVFEKFKVMPIEELRKEPLELIAHFEIDWTNREHLFIELLKLRQADLASPLLGRMIPIRLRNFTPVNIGDISWWLDWMLELTSESHHSWLTALLGDFLAGYVDQSSHQQFIVEFNNEESKFRRILLAYVIPIIDITTDAFTEGTISYLLADLKRKGAADNWRGHPLGNAATERFTIDRLIPLISRAEHPFKKNLIKIIEKAGERHGCRYLLS